MGRPHTLIDEFGADAWRFNLAQAAGKAAIMRIGQARVESGRNRPNWGTPRASGDEWLRPRARL